MEKSSPPVIEPIKGITISATSELTTAPNACPTKITPKISGKVVQLPIDTGMKVHRGDTLAVLESTNLRAQLEASRDYLFAQYINNPFVGNLAGNPPLTHGIPKDLFRSN